MTKILPQDHTLNEKLSKSILWEQMHKYYQELGPKAWAKNLVPYQITSNKILAHRYASLIMAALYDLRDLKNKATASSASEPYYILELGAGHGKFSFYLCKFLEEMNLQDNFAIVYIASDISHKNIEAWQHHPKLKKYIDSGKLDFASFNPLEDQAILLLNAQKSITINSLNNPMFVIANYVFDSLCHEGFKCNKNQLFVSEIKIKYKNKFNLNNFNYKYSYKEITSNYYSNTIFNQILSEYHQTLNNGIFLLPLGALQAIENIKKFSQKDTIFFVADKGNIRLDDFKTKQDPAIAQHSSISFMVNFHALSRYFELTQGSTLVNEGSYTDLQVACFISNNATKYELLKFVTKQVLAEVNPIMMINLSYDDSKVNMVHNLEQILAVLAFSKWDPDLFYDLSAQLQQLLDKAIKKVKLDSEQEEDLMQGLEQIATYFFKLDQAQDLPFVIANIYYSLDRFDLALKFFQISLDEFGPNVASWYNVALCYKALGKIKAAIQALKQALKLKPKAMLAKKMLTQLELKK